MSVIVWVCSSYISQGWWKLYLQPSSPQNPNGEVHVGFFMTFFLHHLRTSLWKGFILHSNVKKASWLRLEKKTTPSKFTGIYNSLLNFTVIYLMMYSEGYYSCNLTYCDVLRFYWAPPSCPLTPVLVGGRKTGGWVQPLSASSPWHTAWPEEG